MKLNEVDFVINKDTELTKNEKELLIEAYRNLFIKLNGLDTFDALLNVTQTNSKEYNLSKEKVSNITNNYNRALNVIENISKEDNIELLLIYCNDNLIGAGRINKINDSIVKVLDIVFCNLTIEEERKLWKNTISFIEDYFTNKGYIKMYLEIPFSEGPLLVRANELGFEENPNDIEVSEDNKTYILNKLLERKNNE